METLRIGILLLLYYEMHYSIMNEVEKWHQTIAILKVIEGYDEDEIAALSINFSPHTECHYKHMIAESYFNIFNALGTSHCSKAEQDLLDVNIYYSRCFYYGESCLSIAYNSLLF